MNKRHIERSPHFQSESDCKIAKEIREQTVSATEIMQRERLLQEWKDTGGYAKWQRQGQVSEMLRNQKNEEGIAI